jgi:hypothetical protein
MNKITTIIRIFLTVALLYGVYTETGIWTTTSLFLTAIGLELAGYIVSKKGL